MGKKKIIDPATIIAIDDTPEMAVPPAPVGEKKKREVSEKQRENLKKGRAALKAKREANRATQEQEATEVTPTPEPIPSPEVKTLPVVKERKPRADKGQARVSRPPPVSRDDFDNFRKELLTSLTPQERIVDRPVDRIVEKYTEKIVERPTTKFVSGSDLLDSIFFRK
jgi:hypothetical protein